MISFRITEDNIYVLENNGPLYVKDLRDFLNLFLQNKNLPTDIQILYDLRESTLMITPDEMDIVFRLADDALKNFSTVKTAIVVTGKVDTAMSYIMKNHSAGEFRKREVFTTYEAALSWLINRE